MGHDQLRDLIGKQRTLEVLDLLATDGPLNYTTVETHIDSSSDVVSDRLATLVDYGLVIRDERSPKDVRYDVTERGEEFRSRITAAEALLTE
jgi:DNA-binding HxlR family transcriptional regulator